MALLYCFALILAVIASILHGQFRLAEAAFFNLGVIYGLSGTNIPDPYSTIELCRSMGIRKIRLMETNDYVMLALNQSGPHFQVSIGVRNDELPEIASSLDAALSWYQRKVQPYRGQLVFDYLVVGDNAITGPYCEYLATALDNMVVAIAVFENAPYTKVTTAVSDSVLHPRFPPSVAAFRPEIKLDMMKVIKALRKGWANAPLLVNVFPYYDYAAGNIPKDFAVFGRNEPYFWDFDLPYWNMYDAVVDAFNFALSGLGGTEGIYVAVAATGWPSAGNGTFATPAIAAEYNQNLMEHIVNGNGTPYIPWQLDGFLYSLYNEDEKPVGPSQYFGPFYPNQTQAYPFEIPNPNFPVPQAKRVIKG